MKLSEVRNKIKFWKTTDRIGPDIAWTHWNLFFRTRMIKLCKRKFCRFANSADFRPGAYAIGCSQITIGERVVIRPGTMLHGEANAIDLSIIIEDDVLIGSGVHIYVENHRFDNPNLPIIEQGHSEGKPVVLKKGCWIGANVIILPGVTIGENAVVGAGSIVTRNVEPYCVVGGSPARLLKVIK